MAEPFVPPEPFNMADHFLDERLREGRGERTAVVCGDEERSYAEIAGLAARYGQVLRGMGVDVEDRVIIALPDGFDFVGAFFGILKLGAVVVMVNPHQDPDDVAWFMNHTRARVAVCGGEFRDVFERAADDARHLDDLLVVGSEDHDHPSFDDLGDGIPDELESEPTHPDDPAVWLFSGGTTGRPKAVIQTHASFANTTELYAKGVVGYREDDVTLSVPKLYFGYATGSNLLFPFSVGARCVLFPERSTPEAVFRQVRAHRPTILVHVPTLVQKMVDHPEADEADLSSLRLATSAGEALPPALHGRWTETFGVELLDGLGTAEMWHIFCSNRPGEGRPGTLGRPVPGFTVEVRDEEGREVPRGEVGNLWVKGRSRALAYWQNMEATVEAFRGPWYASSDLVSMDEEGFVTYHGRADDMLKVSGKWLAPAEVEDCLHAHDAVREVAVVGVTNEAGLTKPRAYVVSDEPSDDLAEELKQHVIDELEPHKHPREVHFLDELPRTHLGKVDRGVLRRGEAGDGPDPAPTAG